MVRFVSVVFLLVSFSLSALAEEIKVWTPTGGPRLILPVGTNQTPEEAAARYGAGVNPMTDAPSFIGVFRQICGQHSCLIDDIAA